MGANAGERKPPPTEQVSVLRPALLLIAIIILGATGIIIAQRHYRGQDRNVGSDIGPAATLGRSNPPSRSNASSAAPGPKASAAAASPTNTLHPPVYGPVTGPPAAPAPVGSITRLGPPIPASAGSANPSAPSSGPSSIDNPPPLPSGTAPAPTVAPDVFARAALYVDPSSSAARARQADLSAAAAGTRAVDGGDPRSNADAIARIADTAQAHWFTAGTPISAVSAKVSGYVRAARAAQARPVLVLDALPQPACGSVPAQGLADVGQYRSWIEQVVAGLGSGPAAVILEPGAVTNTNCLTSAQLTTRLELLGEAVGSLSADADLGLYIDAGTSHTLTPATVASRLQMAGIAAARGFSLNVGNFYATAEQQAYGEALAALLPGAHYVLDTSRNGNGAQPDGPLSSCNPSGRALGAAPMLGARSRHQDANLWVKPPGESDGVCHSGDPAGGSWFESYAIGLVHGSSP